MLKPPTIQFLPATVEELSVRFNKLFCEFIRQKKHEHSNELVFLLDELLRQEAIDRDVYTQLNALLAESLGSGIAAAEWHPNAGNNEDVEMYTETLKTTDDKGDGDAVDMKGDSDEEVDELKRVVDSTLEYVNQHDEELKELLTDIKEEAGEEYLDVVLELKGFIDVLLQDEILENEPVLPKLGEIGKKLGGHILLNRSNSD